MILFVDDEPRYISSFVEELELEFGKDKINCSKDVDEALDFFNHNSNEIKIIILDEMMPPGKTFKNGLTQTGLRTGLFFYKHIRQNFPDLPIIIFTNIPDDYTFSDSANHFEIGEISKKFKEDIDNRKALYLQKEDLFPYELAAIVRKILEQ
jgi:CheY-like chemotaxis protein